MQSGIRPGSFPVFIYFAISFVTLSVASTPAQSAGFLDCFKRRIANAETGLEFKIPAAQMATANQQVDHRFLDETLFILPRNDGEARRAVEILEALRAPHLQVSRQGWGATLDREPIEPRKLGSVKRVVIFEIPDTVTEAKLKEQGLEVIVIDHHAYKGLDRRKPESSLEQLMGLIHWPASRTDEALAVNDRSYIPGLIKMGLTPDEIRAVRKYDLMAQGRSEREVDAAIQQAQALIPKLPRKNGIYVLHNVVADEGILKQELAIQSPGGLASTYVIQSQGGGIGFSGDPEIVQKLLATRFEDMGYAHGTFKQYGGGDPEGSMFFGFKPKFPPHGEVEFLPKKVLDRIEEIMGMKSPPIASEGTEFEPEVKAAGMLPRGSAILTSSGDLSRKGIKHIIHAATGSMSRVGKNFDPTLKSVTDSIRNSLALARAHGDPRVAIPFIGGKIFVERIGVAPQALADHIVESAIKNRGKLELRFVTFGEEDTQLFRQALAKYGQGLTASQVALTPGSITDFSLHGASAIVNAANMEVQFGGGLSGAIGKATGNAEGIDREAHEAILLQAQDSSKQ